MSSSSSLLITPRTPSTPRLYGSNQSSKPTLSSPLAPSSPGQISPVAHAQARRRLQYKATGTSRSSSDLPSRRYFSTTNTNNLAVTETPQSKFLRERLKAKCIDRARRAREKNIQKRRASDLSSDGFEVEMDASSEKDSEEDDFDDEIFRRIMANERHKREHAFRVSFEQSVGSSLDPNMEDVREWERQLKEVEEEPSPPEDLFEEDEEYWASLYEELVQNEETQPSESQESTAVLMNEDHQAVGSSQVVLAQQLAPEWSDFDFDMDMGT